MNSNLKFVSFSSDSKYVSHKQGEKRIFTGQKEIGSTGHIRYF